VDGNMVLFYKPTPKNCAECHEGTIPKSTVKSG
jgi:hypothetical protein